MHKEVFRLAALLACCALATSRIGLIGHELVGHGGVALAAGATNLEVQLFWFAGGWIRYQLPEPSLAVNLAIAMAGIAFELVVGVALFALVRDRTLGRRLLRGVGAALVLHATWYLATGAFQGFGDGRLLYRVLGSWRPVVAIAAGLVTCAATYAGARGTLGALVVTLPGSRRARIAGLIVALLLAAGLHVALARTEIAMRSDTTYISIMQRERDLVIAQELAKWQREHAGIDAGGERARLESAHPHPFPFAWLLGACTALAAIAGAWRARVYPDAPIGNRLLAIAAALAVIAVFAVIGIDAILAG